MIGSQTNKILGEVLKDVELVKKPKRTRKGIILKITEEEFEKAIKRAVYKTIDTMELSQESKEASKLMEGWTGEQNKS